MALLENRRSPLIVIEAAGLLIAFLLWFTPWTELSSHGLEVAHQSGIDLASGTLQANPEALGGDEPVRAETAAVMIALSEGSRIPAAYLSAFAFFCVTAGAVMALKSLVLGRSSPRLSPSLFAALGAVAVLLQFFLGSPLGDLAARPEAAPAALESEFLIGAFSCFGVLLAVRLARQFLPPAQPGPSAQPADSVEDADDATSPAADPPTP